MFVANLILLGHLALGQTLPHRMRVGLSLDAVGATLGLGAQLHGSFRFSDDYRAFDDRHQYINLGIGVGASLSSALSVGMIVPHYLSYGTGRGRSMLEIGAWGALRERLTHTTETIPGTGQQRDRFVTDWQYVGFVLIGYRYTADSGFLFRANGPLPGLAIGWVF